MAASIVQGNLLEASERYIGHQCNCVTSGNGAGLAKTLFRKFPFANVYAGRMQPSIPGTYSLHGNGADQRRVVNFYAQYFPGKPRKPRDTTEVRLGWLLQSIGAFVRDQQASEIALPYGIGCGLAGGDQHTFSEALQNLAREKSFSIIFYQLAP
jgi:hypothetical protein